VNNWIWNPSRSVIWLLLHRNLRFSFYSVGTAAGEELIKVFSFFRLVLKVEGRLTPSSVTFTAERLLVDTVANVVGRLPSGASNQKEQGGVWRRRWPKTRSEGNHGERRGEPNCRVARFRTDVIRLNSVPYIILTGKNITSNRFANVDNLILQKLSET